MLGTRRAKREKLTERITTVLAAERPLREFAGNVSRIAKYAIDEANTLSLERVEIKLFRLPKKLDGFRIIHLSDIHHSPLTGLEHIGRAVKIANRLKPDMFVLTGDYVSHEPEYIEPVAEMLGKLSAEFGTYACLGNHDHWTDGSNVTSALRANGINVLINEGFRFTVRDASFWLAGVDDHMVGRTDLPAALKGSYPDEFKLLLAHNPIIFRQCVRAGIDLTLSGHTHGGQIRIRDSRNRIIRRRRTAGLHRRKDSQIYITRGIGTVILPVRYQCPPEISLLELRSE
ncbi:metallophosphoesterase [Leptolyngbya sp. 7M]|uniref:metallophosphoesterase n=1 Tax=Leptolyngbya sp. 7M TaxID=2812896 RepID=UPI001B8AB841|nr:metallophosphoesterase [Leptolyngbya sp. 7M]QYO65624.1 metallophosphoesterase [Leptolyngbya sp. 7M]